MTSRKISLLALVLTALFFVGCATEPTTTTTTTTRTERTENGLTNLQH